MGNKVYTLYVVKVPEDGYIFFAIGTASLHNIIEHLMATLNIGEYMNVQIGKQGATKEELKEFIEKAGGNFDEVDLPEDNLPDQKQILN